MLSFLGLPVGLFPSGFMTKISYECSIPFMLHAQLILFPLSTNDKNPNTLFSSLLFKWRSCFLQALRIRYFHLRQMANHIHLRLWYTITSRSAEYRQLVVVTLRPLQRAEGVEQQGHLAHAPGWGGPHICLPVGATALGEPWPPLQPVSTVRFLNKFFYRRGLLAPYPTPNMEDQGACLSLDYTLWPYRRGWPCWRTSPTTTTRWRHLWGGHIYSYLI
jgi:hypothetical protein